MCRQHSRTALAVRSLPPIKAARIFCCTSATLGDSMSPLVKVLESLLLPLFIGLQVAGILRQQSWIGSALPGRAVRQAFQFVDRFVLRTDGRPHIHASGHAASVIDGPRNGGRNAEVAPRNCPAGPEQYSGTQGLKPTANRLRWLHPLARKPLQWARPRPHKPRSRRSRQGICSNPVFSGLHRRSLTMFRCYPRGRETAIPPCHSQRKIASSKLWKNVRTIGEATSHRPRPPARWLRSSLTPHHVIQRRQSTAAVIDALNHEQHDVQGA